MGVRATLVQGLFLLACVAVFRPVLVLPLAGYSSEVVGNLPCSQQSPQNATASPAMDATRNEYKVFCALMAGTADYHNRDVDIAKSWGKQCDRLLFLGWMDNATHTPHATIVKKEEDTHALVARKEFRTWKYLADNFAKNDEFDFFLKTDTDTYVIMNNYRKFVTRLDPEVPHYFGKQFRTMDQTRHFVAGSSVSLSRSALRRFGQAVDGKLVNKDGKKFVSCTEQKWTSYGHGGDVALADCLWDLGIYAMNTRDEENRERFMVMTPDGLGPGANLKGWWYEDMSFNVKAGHDCCAEDAIAWHGLDTKKFDQPPIYKDGIWKLP